MITNGFVCGYAGAVTLNEYFPFTSSYIAASSAGDIIFENNLGQAQRIPSGVVINGNLLPIGAKRILSSGVVDGVEYNTTATGLVYFAANKP